MVLQSADMTAAGHLTTHTSQTPVIPTRVPAAHASVIADGNRAQRLLQIDRLHPSFGITLTGSNTLRRRRVDPSEIVLG